MVIDNENTKINIINNISFQMHSNYKEIFKMDSPESGALMEHFYYRLNQTANHTSAPEICDLCPVKAIQRGIKVTPIARHYNTARCGWGKRLVKQLHISTETQWKG